MNPSRSVTPPLPRTAPHRTKRKKVEVQAEMIFGKVHTEAKELQEAVNAFTRAEAKAKEIGEPEIQKLAQDKLKDANQRLKQSKMKQYYEVRCGAVRCGALRYGAVRYDTVRCGAVRYGTVQSFRFAEE